MTNGIKPLVPISTENLEDTARALLQGVPSPAPKDSASDLKGFIYVPSVNLYFAEERSHENLNWKDTHKAIISKGFQMPTPRETWELIFYLRGNLSNSQFRKVYDDILKTTPKDTWHGEWQNAIFTKDGEHMYMQKVTGIDNGGEVVLSAKVKLEDCLTNDRYADISNKTNLTSQGLCKVSDSRNNHEQSKNIYFWYPREGAVARFGAGSGGADLVCGGDPTYSGSSLGVRVARKK